MMKNRWRLNPVFLLSALSTAWLGGMGEVKALEQPTATPSASPSPGAKRTVKPSAEPKEFTLETATRAIFDEYHSKYRGGSDATELDVSLVPSLAAFSCVTGQGGGFPQCLGPSGLPGSGSWETMRGCELSP